MNINNICVFCGASKGASSIYEESARELADALLKAGMTLVYGGARLGLMGVLAEQMMNEGGKVIGVIPQFLIDREIAYTQLTELHIVDTMRERKRRLNEISDAFILLPGGIGSLDEFFEIITLSQLGLHNKPRGILNTANYYNDLIQFLDYSVKEEFWNTPNRDRLIIDNNPNRLLQSILNYQAAPVDRWDHRAKEKALV